MSINLYTKIYKKISESDAKLMIAVTSENGSLLVYNNSTLVWCAELFENLVSIKRANFAGLGNIII